MKKSFIVVLGVAATTATALLAVQANSTDVKKTTR